MPDITNEHELHETPEDNYRNKEGSFLRFASKNYPTWSRNIGAIFRSVRVWSIVAKEDAPAVPSGANQNDIQAHEERLEKFEGRRDKAVQILYNTISQDLRPYIKSIDNPAEMWTTLFSAPVVTAGTAVQRSALSIAFQKKSPPIRVNRSPNTLDDFPK